MLNASTLSPLVVALFVAPLALAPARAQDDSQAPEPTKVEGAHYAIVCHFADAAIAKQALETVEATWPIAAKALGDTKTKPDQPIEVHLYRTAKAFEEAEEKLTGGENKESLGFVHDNRAHVAVQPDLPDAYLAEHGLNYQTRRQLALGAARLCRYALAANHAHHPSWITDGLDLWAVSQVARKLELIGDLEADPYFSTLIKLGQNSLTRAELPSPEEIVAGATDELEAQPREAINALLVEFLQQKKYQSRISRAVKGLIELGDKAAEPKEQQRAITRAMKPKNLEKPFAKWVKELEPRWTEQVSSLEVHGDSWQQLAGAEDSAFCWSTEDAGFKPYSVQGQVTILPGSTTQQLNVLVGGNRAGFLSIAIIAGFGVMVFEYKNEVGEWATLSEVERNVPLGEPIEFEALWNMKRKRELVVRVGGDVVFQQKLIRPMNGNWGVGAQQGSFGVWKGVHLAR